VTRWGLISILLVRGGDHAARRRRPSVSMETGSVQFLDVSTKSYAAAEVADRGDARATFVGGPPLSGSLLTPV